MSNKPLKHSPSPWRIEASTFPDDIVYVLSGEGKLFNGPCFIVAEVMTDEHDARLIAAAPEMYELLKQLASGFFATPGLAKEVAGRLIKKLES